MYHYHDTTRTRNDGHRAGPCPAWALLGLTVLAVLLVSPVRAQTPGTSFLAAGYVEELSIDNPGNEVSGGRMRVGGLDIVLPENLLVTMPGQYLSVADLFRGPHPGYGNSFAPVQSNSGLAWNDAPRPVRPVTAEVAGNIVDGRYIAGLVSLMPQGFNAEGEGSGFVRAIDHAKGELLVGPSPDLSVPAERLARVRINDPLGVYGKKNSDKPGGAAMDERFSVDPGNAPVAAATGFPMCLPRVAPPGNDPLCPVANRPVGASRAGRFTCGPVAAEATAPAHPSCQPAQAAPLRVGDYVTYNGMTVEETPGGASYFAAHAINANLGIYTSPGRDPAYVLTEVSLVGTLGQLFPGIDQEETSRFRIVGFTTDPSRQVDVFAVDVGDRERLLTTLFPRQVAQIGRIRITLPAKANFLPVTRDIRVRIRNHDSSKVVGGYLDSGQYTSPVSVYIAPENTRWGIPMNPVAIPFENFCFLSQGDGPLTTLGRSATATTLRRLAPFPESGHALSQARADGTRSCE